MKEVTTELVASLVYDLSLQIAANEAILDKMLAMFAEASPEGAFALADEMTRLADGLENDAQLPERASATLGTTQEQMARVIEISAKRWRQFAAAAGGEVPPDGGGLRVIVGGKSGD